MFKILSSKTKGSYAAAAVAFFQGFEGLMFPLFGLIFTFTIFQSAAFSTGSLALKEFITLIFVSLMTGPKRIKWIIKKLKGSSHARLFLYSSLFGTSLGNLTYIVAIQLAGVSYGVILTALYPVFSMLLINFFAREKEGWKVWIGVFIAFIGSILFVLLPSVIEHKSFSPIKIAGMVLGGLAAFFWAFEGFLINAGLKYKSNKTITLHDSALIRSIGSSIAAFFVFMPLIEIVNAIHPSVSVGHPFKIFGSILTSWQGSIIIVAISVNLIILRLIHFYAINKAGPKLTAIIDTNNFLIPAFFSIFLVSGGWTFVREAQKFPEPIYESIIWWSWLLTIPILIGVMIVLYFHKPHQEKVVEIVH